MFYGASETPQSHTVCPIQDNKVVLYNLKTVIVKLTRRLISICQFSKLQVIFVPVQSIL